MEDIEICMDRETIFLDERDREMVFRKPEDINFKSEFKNIYSDLESTWSNWNISKNWSTNCHILLVFLYQHLLLDLLHQTHPFREKVLSVCEGSVYCLMHDFLLFIFRLYFSPHIFLKIIVVYVHILVSVFLQSFEILNWQRFNK